MRCEESGRSDGSRAGERGRAGEGDGEGDGESGRAKATAAARISFARALVQLVTGMEASAA